MSTSTVARRWARALFELAADGGRLDEVGGALAEIAAAVGEFDRTLLAPGNLGGDTRRRLGAKLAAKVGTDTELGRFLRLLAERDRLAELVGISDWFEKMVDDNDGRVRMKVRTAEAADAGALERLTAAFTEIAGREVVAEVETDPELIAGAVVELEGRVYDGSVKTRLERLAERMAGS